MSNYSHSTKELDLLHLTWPCKVLKIFTSRRLHESCYNWKKYWLRSYRMLVSALGVLIRQEVDIYCWHREFDFTCFILNRSSAKIPGNFYQYCFVFRHQYLLLTKECLFKTYPPIVLVGIFLRCVLNFIHK